MTKSELIEAVAQRTKITKSRAELVVNCVFDTMTAAMDRGEGIEIRGFGSFTVREYMPYDGRNPRTGKAVAVPQKRLPFFKVGKELKALVNGGSLPGDTAKASPHDPGAARPREADGRGTFDGNSTRSKVDGVVREALRDAGRDVTGPRDAAGTAGVLAGAVPAASTPESSDT